MKKKYIAKIDYLNIPGKTASVIVNSFKTYKKYFKRVNREKKLLVHYDEGLVDGNLIKKGDFVEIIESRPISKRKRFVISSIFSQ